MLFIHTGSGKTLFCDLAKLVAVVMISLLSIDGPHGTWLTHAGKLVLQLKTDGQMNWISAAAEFPARL
jgi:hypothetical protein